MTSVDRDHCGPLALWAPVRTLAAARRGTESMGEEALGVEGLAALEHEVDFEKEVLRKRPYLKKEWCTRVVDSPLRSEPREHNRFRFWGEIPELEGRYLRVVAQSDRAQTRLTPHYIHVFSCAK